MFEVQDLRYATMATVSRCGMVWFSEDVLSTELIFDNYITRLRNVPLEESDEGFTRGGGPEDKEEMSPLMKVWKLNMYICVQFKQSLVVAINW